MKTTPITNELRKLAAHHHNTCHNVKLQGTSYRIHAGQSAAKCKFNEPTRYRPTIIPTMNPHQQALALWKTEHRALAALQRQIDTLGDDIDPKVKKRAENLAGTLEKGHVIWTRNRTLRTFKDGNWIEENVVTRYLEGTSAELIARHLGREVSGKAWKPELTLTNEDIITLSETFILRAL
jgi:hypothetical protein